MFRSFYGNRGMKFPKSSIIVSIMQTGGFECSFFGGFFAIVLLQLLTGGFQSMRLILLPNR
jgi:hypothetical protein